MDKDLGTIPAVLVTVITGRCYNFMYRFIFTSISRTYLIPCFLLHESLLVSVFGSDIPCPHRSSNIFYEHKKYEHRSISKTYYKGSVHHCYSLLSGLMGWVYHLVLEQCSAEARVIIDCIDVVGSITDHCSTTV